MKWDDLQYILAISRHTTMRGASDALGVTHTTVSRRLGAAEEQFGVRLFDRTPDGLFATPAGLELIEVGERVESEIHTAESRVMGRDTTLQGSLRVSVFDFLMLGFTDAFAGFVDRYPGVELTLTATLSTVSLTRREADVAIRLSEAPPDHLIGRKVREVAFAPYASRALVERVGAEAPLAAYPWVGWDERIDGRWLEQWLAHYAPGARVSLRVDENSLLRSSVVAGGLGAFFLPCFEGDASADLVRLAEPNFTRPLWLLTLPELKHTARVRAFMDHMSEALQAC